MADELSTRARHCLGLHLRQDGFDGFDYGHLRNPIRPEEVAEQLTRRDLERTPNLGKKTEQEIVDWLSRHGLELKP